MFKPAFSTLACPDWTLDQIAPAAARLGYEGVELRTFGHAGGPLAGDPALTDAGKATRLFQEAGVDVAGLATGIRFDDPIWPPVVGRLLPSAEAGVPEGKRLVELAQDHAAGYIRVYPFELRPREPRRSTLVRIGDRLRKVCDHARHRDLRVAIENASTLALADDLLEIIDRVNAPELGAAYDLKAAAEAGDDPARGLERLGPHLIAARVRDADAHGRPVPLGAGALPCADFCAAAAQTDAWLVFTWDALWVEGLAPAEDVLGDAVERMYAWSGAPAAPAATVAA